MRLHAGDTLRMKERFLKLENQYKALTLVVAASPDSAKVAKVRQQHPFLDKILLLSISFLPLKLNFSL